MKSILTLSMCLAILQFTAGSVRAVGYLIPAVQKVHWVSGQATLDFEDGVLTVGNIGSSGLDGVGFDVREPGFRTLGTFMDWQWWDPSDSLPIGAMFQSEVLGTVGGIPDQRIATWRMTKTAAATYDSTLDFSSPGLPGTRIVLSEALAEHDAPIIGEIPNVPAGAAVVMRVDPGVLDPVEPFQQAWIVGEGTEEPVQGGIPLPPGMEVFCGGLFECEYHGWPALAELGLRSDGDLVQAIATDPNQTTGILAVVGDGSVRSDVEEITELRLTFANIPEFQIRDLQVLVVPEPAAIALLLAALPLVMLRRRKAAPRR